VTVDGLDADVLIYAAQPPHPLGARIRRLVLDADPAPVGSVLLLPELLIKPIRTGRAAELRDLEQLLARLELHAVTDQTSRFAVDLGARYKLRTVDATHLSTAVLAGADRFVTNNRRDFGKDIDEIDIVYPQEL
jgi:predicted nucleic acid-binding protein